MNLCDHLCDVCKGQRPFVDLADRLERVRQSAEHILQHQRFEWFPDHTIAHSDCIIGHLGNMLCHLQGTSQRLNPHELFVLLASSYLHDIGMQDFRIDGRTIDQLTIDDYELIRDRHAKRSKELVIDLSMRLDRQEFRIDLDDDPQYTIPIALVCQAHSSACFEDTVNELRSSPHRPGNQELRGSLLAALLLMADEFDLHEGRARFSPGIDISSLATLHNHVHHYITEVKVIEGRLATQRGARITFEFPSNSEAYRTDVRWWVVSKLCRQMRRTQSIVESSTSGQLGWDSQVHIQEFTDRYTTRRQLPESAQLRLHYERAEAGIIDRLELAETIKDALCSSESEGGFVEIADRDNSDWSQLLKWLASAIRLYNAETLHICFTFSIAHTPLDIIERCHEQLVSSGLSCSTYEAARAIRSQAGEDRLDELCRALVADLEDQAAVRRVVMILERIDQAEPRTSKWIRKSLLPELQRRQVPLLTIVTYRDSGSGRGLGLGPCFRLGPFSQDVLATHLNASLGYSAQEARDRAQEMHTLSRGTPLFVLDRLHLEEQQSAIQEEQ